MATNFPSSLDTYTDVSGGAVIAAATTNNMQDAIEALEVKIGADSSAVTASIDYLVKSSSSTDPGHLHTTAGISGQIAVAQGGTGASTASAARIALGLGNVEDTAISTWAGTTNVTTLGTIGTGVWNGTVVADTYVANDLTISGGTVNNSVIGGSTAAAGTFTQLDIEAEGDLRLQDATDSPLKYVGLDAPATVGTSYTMTLPDAIGAVGEVLKINNVDGTLEWGEDTSGIVVTDTDLDFTGTPTSYYMQFGYDPAANLDLEYIKLSNTGATYEFDGVMLGIDHSETGYSTGKIVISARHQGSGTTLGTATFELQTSNFNRLGLGGVDLYLDVSKTVVAGSFAVGTGTKFVGYNEGEGGSSTGTVRFYSAYTGGDVALGTASGADDIWSLENHKFSSTAQFADVVTIDVNDASNPALTVDQDNAAGGWIDFVGTMGTPTNDDPTTDAPGDWVQVEIAGSTYYLPAYT